MNSRQLKTAVRLMRDAERRIRPDAAWVARTRETMLKTIRHDAIKQPVTTSGARFRAFILAYVPRSSVEFIRGPVMALASVFVVLLGGSLASVTAAEGSIPGDLLYPVKLATEQARIFMEPEAPNQLRLKAEFAERRGQEIKQLAAATPSPKHTQQIKDTADMLKQDLDAVKLQLHAVAAESSPSQAASAAKDVNDRSDRLASVIKDIKGVVSPEIKQSFTEVQVAAVNTSVKAVQVMIETHDDPAAAKVVSTDDIKRAVTDRVQGLEASITDVASNTTSSTASPAIIKQSVDQLQAVTASLQETKQLLQADKLSDIKNQLSDAAQAITEVEKTVTTSVILPVGSVSGTVLNATTTTSVIPTSTAQSAADTAGKTESTSTVK